MIKINFSPRASGSKLAASVSGTVLTVNGEALDLTEIPDGADVDHPVAHKAFDPVTGDVNLSGMSGHVRILARY